MCAVNDIGSVFITVPDLQQELTDTLSIGVVSHVQMDIILSPIFYDYRFRICDVAQQTTGGLSYDCHSLFRMIHRKIVHIPTTATQVFSGFQFLPRGDIFSIDIYLHTYGFRNVY